MIGMVTLLTISQLTSQGPIALSVACKLICPAGTVLGTLSITRSELYFEVSDANSSKVSHSFSLSFICQPTIHLLYVCCDDKCIYD